MSQLYVSNDTLAWFRFIILHFKPGFHPRPHQPLLPSQGGWLPGKLNILFQTVCFCLGLINVHKPLAGDIGTAVVWCWFIGFFGVFLGLHLELGRNLYPNVLVCNAYICGVRTQTHFGNLEFVLICFSLFTFACDIKVESRSKTQQKPPSTSFIHSFADLVH